MRYLPLTRRTVLKTAALGSVAAITAPYVRGSYAAGKLTLGCWDHWVPRANDTLTKLCNEWGEKNKVEVRIDYITSQGEKDKLTAAAEAQAGTGHDIMSHRDWNIQVHQRVLEPVDDVVNQLIKQYGTISPTAEYLAKINGVWRGVPHAIGSQVKPCCSRIDLYKEYAGIDLRDIFPADELKYDKSKTDQWNWDLYLSSAEKLFKAGYPVGLPMGQTADAVDWVGALFNSFGVVMVDEKNNVRINSNETRQALEYLKKLMAVNPPEVYAWDNAGNNRWLISGKGSSIMNSAERLGGRQARQSEGGGELLDPRDAEGPERPLRRGGAAVLRGLELLPEQVGSERPVALRLAERSGQATCRDLVWLRPAAVQEYVRSRHLEDSRAAAWHRLFLPAAWRRADVASRGAGPIGGRCPDLQSGHQYRPGVEIHARGREARRRDKVGRKGARRNTARLIAE